MRLFSPPDILTGPRAVCGRTVDASALANALGPTREAFTSEERVVNCKKCRAFITKKEGP